MAGTAESELIMAETHLSFYLKAYRIRIFIDALRGIGSPSRICIMLEENGKRLLIAPYTHKDFRSHRVPSKVYEGTGMPLPNWALSVQSILMSLPATTGRANSRRVTFIGLEA